MATSRTRSQPPPPGGRGRREPAAPVAPTPPRPWFRALPRAQSPLLALVVLLAVGVLAVGAAAGRPALAAGVLVVQLILGLCWLTLLQATLATGVLVGLAALACDTLLLRDESADAGSVAGVVGVAVFVAIAAQLARRQRRDVTGGLASSLSGVLLVAAAALLLPIRQFDQGQEVILTALVGVAVALVVARIVPGPALLIRAAGLVLAVVVAGRFGVASQDLSAGAAAGTAAAAAALALVVDLGMLRLRGEVGQRQRAALRPVAALLPVVAAVPAVYVAGWIIGG
jgi:hypothetical protein